MYPNITIDVLPPKGRCLRQKRRKLSSILTNRHCWQLGYWRIRHTQTQHQFGYMQRALTKNPSTKEEFFATDTWVILNSNIFCRQISFLQLNRIRPWLEGKRVEPTANPTFAQTSLWTQVQQQWWNFIAAKKWLTAFIRYKENLRMELCHMVSVTRQGKPCQHLMLLFKAVTQPGECFGKTKYGSSALKKAMSRKYKLELLAA